MEVKRKFFKSSLEEVGSMVVWLDRNFLIFLSNLKNKFKISLITWWKEIQYWLLSSREKKEKKYLPCIFFLTIQLKYI